MSWICSEVEKLGAFQDVGFFGHPVHDRVRVRKAMEGAEAASFDDFLKFALDNTAMRVSYGLIVLQQYHSTIRNFRYRPTVERLPWKRMKEGWMEAAL